ncbi:MAG TPA: SAM-dependent methyltransferase [Verrucomicrobiales bacterium]|nr:SAM-dependent methyltransferase [Verrucomicrobiales bacterium]HCN76566.1 SAM-dependent methyltransferase [Verrucomicrobiales bacterium]HRJ09757.1 class I SAM-dependent methyltransferase [Prosthecobacter sp.]HRK16541.1 class I SAM-dependent methyltransferase [Prosthecobacter sp.]
MRLLLSPLLLAAAAIAQDSPAPPPPSEYQGRVIAQTMHWQGAGWLIRNKREREEGAERMREELRLKPGMTVCDLGSGNGYHTLPMAEKVGPEGRVYAVDIQPEMLEMLKQRAEARMLENIECIINSETDPKIPAGSCDMILLVDVYHEFSHPEEMLAGIRKALKPDGVVVLVEFRAEDESVPIKPEHKMTKAQINKELEHNGFKLAREFDGLPWQHMMFFGLAEK